MALILTSAGTYYLVSTEQSTSCKDGWQYIDKGEREGQYICTSSTPDRYRWCYAIKDSANTIGYWCEIGIVNMTDPVDLKVQDVVDNEYQVEESITLDFKTEFKEELENINNLVVDCSEITSCTYTSEYKGIIMSYSLGPEEINDDTPARILSYFEEKYNSLQPKETVINEIKAEEVIIKINTEKIALTESLK